MFWCLEKNLLVGPTLILCLHSLDWLSFLFVLFLFLCFCLFSVFWVLVCFFSILFVILALSFLHGSALMLLLLLHVLTHRFSVRGRGLPFLWDCLGGSFGYGHDLEVNIFFGFSHSRGVWVKTGAALEDEGSYDCFVASKCMHLRGQNKTTIFKSSWRTIQK